MLTGLFDLLHQKDRPRDWSSEVNSIAGLEPVLVGHLPACVLNRIILPGVCVLRMLEHFGRGFHPEMERDEIINKI